MHVITQIIIEVTPPSSIVHNITLSIVLLCLLMLSAPGYAITIQYQATDLPDMIFGIDEWRYDYTLSDYNFTVDTGFVIFFDPLLYADLQDPAPSVNGDWDVLVIQPNAFNLDDGFYDAASLVNSPLLSDAFILDFVWLGVGMPATQAFEVYDAAFNVLVSSNTSRLDTTSIPLPSPFILLGSGLLLTNINRKNKQHNHASMSIEKKGDLT